jgi:hypothetical protein
MVLLKELQGFEFQNSRESELFENSNYARYKVYSHDNDSLNNRLSLNI